MFYNSLHTKAALRVAERLKTQDLRKLGNMGKLGNMPVSALLPLNGIFPMLVKRSKTLAYTKIPQKIENLSKMVPGATSGTLCSQYQMASSNKALV